MGWFLEFVRGNLPENGRLHRHFGLRFLNSVHQCHRSHYQLGFQGSIVPSIALAEAQVVIYLFFR